jgi:hypothetical protein
MKCPFCRHDIAAAWQPFVINSDHLGRHLGQPQAQLNTTVLRDQTTRVNVTASATWLICQNVDCQQIVVQITRTESGTSESWIALPKRPAIPLLHQLVVDPFRQDYLEAYTILEDSPRMSAVLSRRLLADLLEKYAGLKQYSLAQRIDEFIGDTRHPLWIRQNLHYLREMGDFGAHTQQDKTAVTSTVPTPAPTAPTPAPAAAEPVIINVDKVEAEWTLTILADLFEYFIIAPQRDRAIRASFDKKLADAQRKPITPLTS